MWWGLFKPYGYCARIWCRSSLFESKPGYFVIFSLGNTYFSNSLSLPRSINRIRTLFQKQVLRTFPGSRLIFPRLQISPHSLSFPRFQNKFSLRSTYISYKVNSFLKSLLLELATFPGLSRTCSLFSRPSSPGKCQNKNDRTSSPGKCQNKNDRTFQVFQDTWKPCINEC